MNTLMKMLKIHKLIISVIAVLLSSFALAAIKTDTASFVDTSAHTSDFTAIPPFIETATGKPSVVMAFDVSGSMLHSAYEKGALREKDLGDTFDAAREGGYYGYFDPTTNYRYDAVNEVFWPDASGDWNGSFMNWLTMRRVDVARKVMIGGKVNDRDGETLNAETVWVLEGEIEYRDTDAMTLYDDNSSAYSPIPDGTEIVVSKGQITIGVTQVSDELEFGTYTNSWKKELYGDPTSWPQIQFANDYINPVVVAVTMSYEGGDPSIARVTDVTDENAKIGLAEWKSAYDDHGAVDTIYYIVAEEGCHEITMSDLSVVDFCAGIDSSMDDVNNAASAASVTFDSSFSSTPAVFAGVGSYNNDDQIELDDFTGLVAQVIAADTDGFDTYFRSSHDNAAADTMPEAEDVHWVAIEKTTGKRTAQGVQLEVGDVGSSATSSFQSHSFTNAFSSQPDLIVGSQSDNASEPYFVRIENDFDENGFEYLIQAWDNTNLTGAESESLSYFGASAADGFKVRIVVYEEPKGIVQNNNQKVNFGLSVYNFDHMEASMSTIIGSNRVHGQTMNPCYPIFENDRWPAAADADDLATDGMQIETFNLEDGNTRNYLCVPTSVHAPNDNIVRVIEEYPMIWGTTPIAETVLDVGRYVKQDTPHYNAGNTMTYDHDNNAATAEVSVTVSGNQYPDFGTGNDWNPYYDSIQLEELRCKKVFMLNFNDGAPYKDYDGAGHLNSGDDYYTISNSRTGENEALDEVALALRANDCKSGLADHQEVVQYYVFAALDDEEQSSTSLRRMMEAAARGGFNDEKDENGNTNNLPDPMWPPSKGTYSETEYNFYEYYNKNPDGCDVNEWDGDGDCLPDTFYLANDGDQISTALQDAINDILARSASGGAASVVSTTSSGEGALFQSSFAPSRSDEDATIRWIGDIQALLIDSNGYIRNDGGTALKLEDYATDPIITTCYDTENKKVRMDLATDPDDIPTSAQIDSCEEGTFPIDPLTSNQFKPLWSASDNLSSLSNDDVISQRASYRASSSKRYIRTAIKSGGNLTVVDFLATSFDPTSAYGLLDTANTTDANTLIEFIRGKDQTGMRNRTLDGVTYRMGDVVYSTPIAVGRPSERLNLVYDDDSYNDFFQQYRNRRTVVYVGGNDGLLHAFNGGWYDRASSEFKGELSGNSWGLGDEIWAYAPFNLLPHLKALSEADYGVKESDHNYFIDQTPYIFDGKIFGDDGLTGQPDSTDADGNTVDTHPGGWGTVLVVGFRTGGGTVSVYPDPTDLSYAETMRPAYLIFDITDPEQEPALLGEFTHEDLGMTLSTPTALTVIPTDATEAEWYMVMGSGPSSTISGNEQVASEQNAHLFMLDLKTMSLETSFDTDGVMDLGANFANSFVSDLAAADWDLDVTTDAIYFGTTQGLDSKDSSTGLDWPDANLDGIPDGSDGIFDEWSGKLMRLQITPGTASAHTWTVSELFDVEAPVSTRPSLSFDANDNRWIHTGTGRYFNASDIVDTTDGKLVGLKEPRDSSGVFTWATITGGLVDVSNAVVEEETGDLQGSVSVTLTEDTVQYLEEEQMKYTGSSNLFGWTKTLDDTGFLGSRAMGSPTILGGFLSQTTFAPSIDSCEVTGSSNLHALRYTTGTAWFKHVFEDPNTVAIDNDVLEKVEIGDTASMSPGIHLGGSRGDGEATLINLNSDLSITTTTESNLEGIKSKETSWREM